jgi:hypothetical protein
LIDCAQISEILFGELASDVLLDEGDELEPHHRIDTQIRERRVIADSGRIDIEQDAEALAKTTRKNLQNKPPKHARAETKPVDRALLNAEKADSMVHAARKAVKVKSGSGRLFRRRAESPLPG